MTDLVPRTDVPADFQQQMEMARVLADSTLLPAHLRGKPANVLLIMSGARALNIPTFWAFQTLYVVDGRLSQAADLMKALVIRAGHKFRVLERSQQRARVQITRSDDPDNPYVAEFTWEDAKNAKLTGKDNWTKYPKAMMVARATAIAVRDMCPEVLFGVMHTPDELGAVTDDDGVPVDNPNSVVEMPTPEKVTEQAHSLSVWVDTWAFAERWKIITDLGWALEKIPGTDESLKDRAVDTLCQRVLHPSTDNVEKVRELWKVASGAGLLGEQCSSGITLSAMLTKRADFIDSFNKAAYAAATLDQQGGETAPPPSDEIVVELPAEDVQEEKPE